MHTWPFSDNRCPTLSLVLLVTLSLRNLPIPIDGQPVPMLFLAAGPEHRQPSNPVGVTQAKDVPPVARRQETAASLGKARQPVVAHFERELGADHVAVRPADETD